MSSPSQTLGLKTLRHFVSNNDGWHLSLHQSWDELRLVKGRRPVLIVPGYGMNSYIFSFHSSGPSLESYLAHAGFEVWRVDLRAQGSSVSVGGGENYRMEDLALTDLGAAIDAALLYSKTGADRADILGASLGGTLMFVQAVLNENHRMGSLVAMGAPLRWEKVNPFVRALFAWPMLAGAVRIKGTRRLAEIALPHLVKRAPWLLSLYLNPSITDTAAARQMVKTVEDPNRHINRQLAHWIKDKDLILKGVNISQSIGKVTAPFLCVLANADGIVPKQTAEFSYKKIGSKIKKLIRVGDKETKVAHADLFISSESHEKVFAPLSEWLIEHNGALKPAAE